jgi:hypothetical protein
LLATVRNIQNYLWSTEKNEDVIVASLRISLKNDQTDRVFEVETLREESLEDLQHRYSLVHAHPSGPWQAILKAVQVHYSDWETKKESPKTGENHSYLVLDVACGPRGEPGTTIANALPHAIVHCTDSCAIAIEAVPVVATSDVESHDFIDPTAVPSKSSPHTLKSIGKSWNIPPSNLSKSVCNLDLLSKRFAPNSMHAIVCCYGYGLSSNIVDALEQAYTVLRPDGILVLGTWKHSPLLALGHDVLTTLRSGTGDSAAMLLMQHQNDLDVGLPPLVRSAPVIEHSGLGDWEALLSKAGFRPSNIVSSGHTYPMNMGSTRTEQLNLGTILIRDELQHMNAYTDAALRFTEEAFWTNLPKYRVGTTYNAVFDSNNVGLCALDDAMHPRKSTESDVHFIESNIMWMPSNKFMLTVSTK